MTSGLLRDVQQQWNKAAHRQIHNKGGSGRKFRLASNKAANNTMKSQSPKAGQNLVKL